MRKFLIGSASVALLASFLAVVAAAPAYASITSPGSGATISGNATFSAGGTGSSLACALVDDTSSTTIELVNSSGTVLDSASSSEGYGNDGAPSASFTYETEHSPNGTYTVHDYEYYYSYYINFFSTGCNHNENTYSESVTIDNQSKISYTGSTSGAPGQSVAVSAQLGESGGNGVVPPAGQTVCFSLSGQSGNACTTTNSAGVASTNLTVTGAPRGATITASYAAQYYAASSASVGFTVTKDPTNVSVTTNPSGSASYGQSVQICATASSAIGSNPNGAPTGTMQFEDNGADLGSPVNMSGGEACTSESSLAAASYTISAVYGGDANYMGNTGSTSLAINPAQTSTSIFAVPTSSVYGQSVDFTATVVTSPPGSGTPTGNVSFEENGSPLGSPVALNGSGQASSGPVLLGDANTYTIEAVFQPSTDFGTSSASLTYTVNKASTSTSLSTNAAPYAVYGQSIQFSSSVTAVPPGAGTPTGTVDFQVEGVSPGTTSQGSYTDIGSGSLNGNTAASPPISTLNPGVYNVEAIYSGDNNFTTSSATISQTVTPDTTTTALSSSANPSVYGQPVTVTATVSANPPGAGTPTGEVDFQVVNNAPGSTATDLGDVPLLGGKASIALPTEPAGSYTLTATYEGSPLADFQGSSTTLTQTINQDPTTTALTSSVSPSVWGQPVTFTATVTANAPGSGNPTGSVTFYDGSTKLGTSPLSVGAGGDQATYSSSSLSVGTHAVSAVYSGDANFLTSTGDVTQVVNQASTTTSVTQNGSIEPGQSVTFTATVAAVSPGAGTPSGTVTFYLDGAPFDTETLNGASPDQATSTGLTGLSPGGYTVTATYSGDTDFLTSTGTVGQSVTQAATTTSLQVAPNPATYSQPVTLIATVTPVPPASGSPTGTVDFYDGSNLLGSALLSGGSASLTTPSLPVGTDGLSVSYVGDAEFEASQSSTVNETVGGIPTSTSLTSSPNPSSFGQPVTLTATVAPQSPYTGTPPGTVTFTDGSTTLGTAALSSGSGGDQASITVSSLAVGANHLSASYSGGGTYDASATSTPVTQTVGKATTTLTAAPTNLGFGLSATLTTPWGPVGGATLVFVAGSTVVCSVATASNGTAGCSGSADSLEIIANGGYSVSYAGNPDYTSATASAPLE